MFGVAGKESSFDIRKINRRKIEQPEPMMLRKVDRRKR